MNKGLEDNTMIGRWPFTCCLHASQKPNYGKRTLGEAKITSPAYRYSSLAELVDGYADIYGVVVNVTLPKKTSGRDFCVSSLFLLLP